MYDKVRDLFRNIIIANLIHNTNITQKYSILRLIRILILNIRRKIHQESQVYSE